MNRKSALVIFLHRTFSDRKIKSFLVMLFRLGFILSICYIIVNPLLTKVSMSFMDKADIYDRTVKLIPKHFTLLNYPDTYKFAKYGMVLSNTVLLSIISSITQVFSCTVVGYGFARFKFKGRNIIFILVILMMIIPTQVLMTPLYLNLMKIGLVGSFSPFIALGITATAPRSGLYIFLARQFFRGFPKEIDEAAMIDGANPYRIFWSVILQSAVPIMVTIGLFSFVWQWGDNTYTSLFYSNLKVLSNTLNTIGYNVQQSINGVGFQFVSMVDYKAYFAVVFATLTVLTIAPLILIYVVAQQYFIESIERTGIVG